MKFKTVLVIIIINVNLPSAFSQSGNSDRTVSECTSGLKAKIWWNSAKHKAEKYCEEYSQLTIDCATNLMQAKPLTYTKFDVALKDCIRAKK